MIPIYCTPLPKIRMHSEQVRGCNEYMTKRIKPTSLAVNIRRELTTHGYSASLFCFFKSLVVYRLVHPPVTRESGVRLPAREAFFFLHLAVSNSDSSVSTLFYFPFATSWPNGPPKTNGTARTLRSDYSERRHRDFPNHCSRQFQSARTW